MQHDTFKKLRGEGSAIGNELGRAGSYPVVYPKRPEGEQLRLLRAVAVRARNAADARLLIDALGILEN